ncbi:Scr1 family TA system antitoxin-like transcriptional regulator [Kribbella italica]|uniref:Transcriptional regulator with XRE-family HTH domain n=1 Tax=Kribbella italica TaxID=1540520 RepID=A0A7W9J424_9ACTN|nr:transcriptional regulator with XRE-family HTH domain [Kribbella italica]
MTVTPLEQRKRLGQELRRLRSLAGLSGDQLATRVGISQAKVSRIETNVTARPAMDVIARWLDAVDATTEERERVMLLAEAVVTDISSWQAIHRGSLEDRQRQLLELDELASQIRHFQPFLVPGPFQTAEYAHAVIESARFSAGTDVDAAVAMRMKRGARLRDHQDGPQYHVVVTEAAACWVPKGNTSLRRAQLEHLILCANAPRITLQVILNDAPMEMSPMSGFVWVTYSDPAQESVVRVETPSVGLALGGSDDLATYAIVWDRMLRAAMSPDESADWLAVSAHNAS